MTGLLIFREHVRNFYKRYQRILKPVVRFILGVLLFFSLCNMFPYSEMLSGTAVILVLALICTWMPIGAVFFLSIVYTCAQLASLMPEIAGIYLVLFLLAYLIYVRLETRSCIPILMVPIALWLKIPHVLAILVGMFIGPAGIIPTSFGLFLYYFSVHVKDTVALFSTASSGDIQPYQYLIEQIFTDKQMLLVILVFSLVIGIVWAWYRMSHNDSWNQAIIIGSIAGMLLFLAGGYFMDLEISVIGVVIGFFGAAVIGLIVQFFRCVVDYTRVEYVQFEDDEYYYYVKAVPKVSVAQKEVSIKRINTRKHIKDQDDSVEEVR